MKYVALLALLAASACTAEDVTYTTRVQPTDGSLVTTGSDGSRAISRHQASDDSWATEGTDVDGDSIYATTRVQPTDGSRVTTVRGKK